VSLAAIATLAITVLWRSSADHRMLVCVIVSAAAIMLAVQSLFARKLLWGLAFLGVLGLFTPFRTGHLSPIFVTLLDMAALVLFAISPMVLKRTETAIIPTGAPGSVAATQPFINQPE
jgi:hypothetical protein